MTDKIMKGEVKVVICHTTDMLGDFFTKPLQGSLFVRMREKVLILLTSARHLHSQECLRGSKNETLRKDLEVLGTPNDLGEEAI